MAKKAAVIVDPVIDLHRLREFWSRIDKSWEGLYALLLYTQNHREIRRYVRKSIRIIDDLSGEDVFVLIFDDLKKANPPTKIFSLMRELGLKFTQVPCLAFFKSLDDIDIYCYNLKDDKTCSVEFLHIFTLARKCCQSNKEKEKKLACLRSKLIRRKIKLKLLPFLKKAGKIIEKKITN